METLVSMAKPGCQETCVNITIPYPFGIGAGCYMNKAFEVICEEQLFCSSPLRFLDGSIIYSISLEHVSVGGKGVISYNISEANAVSALSSSDILNPQYFSVSHTQNKFVGIGCDIFAYIIKRGSTNYSSGCASLCHNDTPSGVLDSSSCFGYGCCQTTIPNDLTSFSLEIDSINTVNRSRRSQEQVSLAYIVCKDVSYYAFNFTSPAGFWMQPQSYPMVLNWVIGNITCREARLTKNYACHRNSYCVDSTERMGYQCHCLQGYQGNPYLHSGCQDINECVDWNNTCQDGAVCINTPGNYLCTCPPGHSRDGNEPRNGCKRDTRRQQLEVMISYGISIAIVMLSLITFSFWIYLKIENLKEYRRKQKFFKRNGGLLLLQQLSYNKGSVTKTKLYHIEDMVKATDNFKDSRVLGRGGYGTVYKGMLSDGSIVAIKKSNILDQDQVGRFINEVFILTQINHRNIVKLLGCCLEYEVPLLVYEYVSNGTLSHHLHDEGFRSKISCEDRLRIAGEVAGALTYLHSHASTAIYHRDVKSSNILLDENYKAVLCDFGLSRSLPLSRTHLTTFVGGTFGYLDPEYFRSGQFTDKSDVYAYGVVLAELLTGRKAICSDDSDECLVNHFRLSMKHNCLFKILEPTVLNNGKQDEILAVASLAKRCMKLSGKKRPSMKEVAADLDRLRRYKSTSREGVRTLNPEGPRSELVSLANIVHKDISSYNFNLTSLAAWMLSTSFLMVLKLKIGDFMISGVAA
ncbi:hypothetical protein LguiA_018882 [Lonicera macranthoides]